MTVVAQLLDGVDLEHLPFTPEELEGLTVDELEQLLIDVEMAELETLDTLARTMPMAVVPLWIRSAEHIASLPEWAQDEVDPDRPSPSQRDLFIGMLTHMISIAGGGNRGGKTFCMFLVLICLMLGRDHPMVACFLELNRIPPELVPLGPGHVFLVARSAAQSRKHHRPAIDSLLPPERKWIHKNSLSEAFVEVGCPGYDKPGRMEFMSIDQDEDKYRGIEGRGVGIDEEPTGEEGKKKFTESCRAVSGMGGHVIIAATAQDGETWMVEMAKDPDQCFSGNVDALLNYLVQSTDGLLKNLKRMTPHERLTRRFGIATSKAGGIYPEFAIGDRDRWGRYHVCEPFEDGIPADWPRFIAADFGLKNPTAVVWGAVGDDGTVYIYREWVESGLTWAQHADKLHELMDHRKDEKGVWRTRGKEEDGTEWCGEVIQAGWGDPGEPDGIRQWSRSGIPVRRAHNSVDPGIDCVRDFMRVQPDERSRFKVWSTCPKTVKCLQDYRWNEKMRAPTPLKKDDHEADAVRYLCMGIARWYGLRR